MTHFLFNLASFNLFLILLFLFRKLLGKQLSPLFQGKYWHLTGLGFLFFIPNQFFSKIREMIFYRIQSAIPNGTIPSTSPIENAQAILNSNPSDWMNNNALPANGLLERGMLLLGLLWTAGFVIFLIRSTISYLQFHKMIRSTVLVEDKRIYTQLQKAAERLRYKKKDLVILQSDQVRSPSTFGVFHPRIILPNHFIDQASEDQLFFILLHELVHQKNKDAAQNYLLIGIAILNWFNPFSYLIVKQAREDREIACDQRVMHLLEEEDIYHYGTTLLSLAQKREHSYLLSFSGKRNELRRRIESISSFHPSSTKTITVKFGLISALVIAFFFVIPQARTDEKDPFSHQEKWIEQKSDPLFDQHANNSLVIYDEAKDRYLAYNQAGGHTRYSPDSTYKIWSALFALDEKTITDIDNQKAWDGTTYPFKSWNRDQTLQTALTNSTNWYFQQLDSELGKEKLKEKFHSINYGNMNLLGGIDHYWLESSLKISPFEQVNLLRKLVDGDLHFSTKDVSFVKEAIRLQTQSDHILYGKTGTGNSLQTSTGWFIGLIETKKGNYYFACHLQGNSATGTAAAQKTLAILRKLEIY